MGTCHNHPDRNGILVGGIRLCDICLGIANMDVTGGIPSIPPTGGKKITNLYWDAEKQEVVYQIED
jgi:hypothetical protein